MMRAAAVVFAVALATPVLAQESSTPPPPAAKPASTPAQTPVQTQVDPNAKVTITAGQLDALLRAAASQGAAKAAKANADLDQCRSEATMADVRRQLGVDK